MPHYTDERLLRQSVNVDLAGCGGNGSQMLTGLARLDHALRALGHPGLQVRAFDPDTVSEANMGRQLFSRADVGLPKAVVLVHRINAFFGTRWEARPTRYATEAGVRTHLVIACVDSTRARHAVYNRLGSHASTYLMDMGNRAVDGQVVLGEVGNGTRHSPPPDHVPLPDPYDLFPELIDRNAPQDDTPSCGLAEALERQELFVNQSIATPALQILWALFRYGRLDWHGAFVNLQSGRMTPIRVPAPPAAKTVQA